MVIDSWDTPSSSGLMYNIFLICSTLTYGRQNKNQGFRGHKSGFPLLFFLSFYGYKYFKYNDKAKPRAIEGRKATVLLL